MPIVTIKKRWLSTTFAISRGFFLDTAIQHWLIAYMFVNTILECLATPGCSCMQQIKVDTDSWPTKGYAPGVSCF